MKKFIGFLIPVLIILLFIVIMNSGIYLKQPKSDDENFPKYLRLTFDDIQNDRWANALYNIEKLDTAIKKITSKIQYSVELDEIKKIQDNISRTKGYIAARSKPNALGELSEAYNHWENLGK